MAIRNHYNQSLHDRVIQAAVNRLDKVNYDVYSNPGSQKNTSVGDNYPDIIITKKGDRTVQFIIEVETSESVNINEAHSQWKKYASEIRTSFYILVPLAQKNWAITLCKQIGISVRFGTYTVDPLGNITNIKYV
jgi:hypothetical protein